MPTDVGIGGRMPTEVELAAADRQALPRRESSGPSAVDGRAVPAGLQIFFARAVAVYRGHAAADTLVDDPNVTRRDGVAFYRGLIRANRRGVLENVFARLHRAADAHDAGLWPALVLAADEHGASGQGVNDFAEPFVGIVRAACARHEAPGYFAAAAEWALMHHELHHAPDDPRLCPTALRAHDVQLAAWHDSTHQAPAPGPEVVLLWRARDHTLRHAAAPTAVILALADLHGVLPPGQHPATVLQEGHMWLRRMHILQGDCA